MSALAQLKSFARLTITASLVRELPVQGLTVTALAFIASLERVAHAERNFKDSQK